MHAEPKQMGRKTMNKLRAFVAAALISLPVAPAVASAELDVSDPDQALLANNKLFCANEEGETALYWWYGEVYSRIPGEKDTHIFDVQGFNVRQCGKLQDETRGLGFKSVSREIMLYLDPETGEVLKTWDNPWTGETVDVMQVHNDPVNGRRPSYARDENGNPSATFDPKRVVNGTALVGGGVARLFYENPLGGDYQDYEGGKYHASEFLTMAYPVADALNADETAIQDAVISWGRISGWLPWMKMRGRTGLMVHYTTGMRLKDWSELPEVLRSEVEANYPKFRSPPPTDDPRPNETTWTVFKRWIEQKRAETE